MAKRIVRNKTLSQKESEIPGLAKIAVEKAYRQALDAGQKVLVADGGVLYEVTKDSRRAVKRLRPRKKVKVGKVIKLS